MSVLLTTSVGEIVIDLFIEECPQACENFLKLCAIKYYHQSLIYNVQANYIVQMGDPTGTGRGGSSIYGVVHGPQYRFFPDELSKHRKVNKVGYVGMAHIGDHPDTNHSQFFITLRGEDMEHLGKNHTIFGEVAEGFDVLTKINGLFCDDDSRPYQDVRILHTYILDDPFSEDGDKRGDSLLNRAMSRLIPPDSPQREYPPEEKIQRRIPYKEDFGIDGKGIDGRTSEEIEEEIRRKEAKSRAIVLEMTGDIPDADVKPPVEVLFICKLNPVTRDEDLELIFSRFGKIKSCEIIRDHKTGDSLNYAFIEFETEASCIAAYEKMNNALIDDRRIKVDFSQSVSKLWNRFLLKPRIEKKKLNGTEQPVAKIKPRIANDPRDAKSFSVNESKEDDGHSRSYHRVKESENDKRRDREKRRDDSREKDRGVKRERFDRDDKERENTRDRHEKEKNRESRGDYDRDHDRVKAQDKEREDRSRDHGKQSTQERYSERQNQNRPRESERDQHKDSSRRERDDSRERLRRAREDSDEESLNGRGGSTKRREDIRDRHFEDDGHNRSKDKERDRGTRKERGDSRSRPAKTSGDVIRKKSRSRSPYSSESEDRYRRDKGKKSKRDFDR